MQQQLKLLYPRLRFHFNRTDAIDAELDVYIPRLRLAFELNGIFHYEPVYGPDKLRRTQHNDCRKRQACNERGITLCVIDVSEQKYFKEKTALPFLATICNIIGAATENRTRVSGSTIHRSTTEL